MFDRGVRGSAKEVGGGGRASKAASNKVCVALSRWFLLTKKQEKGGNGVKFHLAYGCTWSPGEGARDTGSCKVAGDLSR